jgi:hypothetical protein
MAEKSKAEKIDLKKLAVKRSETYRLNPKDLYVEPGWNVRNLKSPESIKHIEGLALSISKVGVEQALTVAVRDNKVMVTDGGCRMAAIALAEKKYGITIESVPVQSEGRGRNELDYTFSMLTRNAQLDLNMAEQADAVKRAIALGANKKDIADRWGKSITHVDNCLLLLEADPAIIQHVRDGRVTSRLAVDTIRAKGNKALPVITKAIESAQAVGKSKATKRHAPKSAPKVQWGTHGPECVSLLEALDRAYDELNECPDSIADVVNSWREYKDASNLTSERPKV